MAPFRPKNRPLPEGDEDAGGVLVPELYIALHRKFHAVRVSKAGESMRLYRPMADDKVGPLDVEDGGEEYRVNCPDCSDDRFRLHFNHRFGSIGGGSFPGIWLVHCFNEGCEGKPGRRRTLFDDVFGPPPTIKNPRDLPRYEPGTGVSIARAPRMPGLVTPLDRLRPDHAARRYVEGRGFDADRLALDWGVGYCPEADDEFHSCTHRLIIPFRKDGKLIGWQARFLGERDWKAERIVKYLTMTGFRKSKTLYNLERASAYKVAVCVEGVLDAWAVGPAGVALLGKKPSAEQERLLGAWPAKGGLLVMLLDPEAAEDSAAALAKLKAIHGERVIEARTPPGTDPGSSKTADIWGWIRSACADAGLSLDDYA